ncbi:MAG: RecQ family ATP-dependent DNA helicase [Lautropia sp.]|nr:RecQ family ATP-dependent DNA helicase [Lautropia sp.]
MDETSSPNNLPSRGEVEAFLTRCLAFDLEVGRQDHRIHLLGAIRYSEEQEITHAYMRGELLPALQDFDRFAQGAEFLLGHNIIHFDLPHLRDAAPTLAVLQRPAIDTLWLNPLAFPRNPYHHLVKHEHDGRLTSGHRNDPVADARTATVLLGDQIKALKQADTALLTAWHWLTTQQSYGFLKPAGFDAVFQLVREQPTPDDATAFQAIEACMQDRGCPSHAARLTNQAREEGWSLAYALAWLSVAGGNSVIPPWVRKQFPNASRMIRLLRDTPCEQDNCSWCSTRHDAISELKRLFPAFSGFRPEPRHEDTGKPLQQVIVETAMRGTHVLGILPTGTGKSLCYQIPVLSRFEKTGALAVVISPLVALMEDQVNGLAARNVHCAAAINGLQSMPERAAVLERIRLGDVGILIIAPEQLRNRSVRAVLQQREIGAWVFDEAHCLSKWGHDFRPDYRYVGRYIRERAGDGDIAPILCLTATAKPDVVQDICSHFQSRTQSTLQVLNGGAERQNLRYRVIPTQPEQKMDQIRELLEQCLTLTRNPGSSTTPDRRDGAIIYCATRKRTEEVAAFLNAAGIQAGYFHAGLKPDAKKETQQRFIDGELRAMAATNAFGMGIDKPDVRLVIHADIPGSLENYLQEAGRAGRDRLPAECVLLYTNDDVERQFGMSARSRLSQRDIQTVLRAVRQLARRPYRRKTEEPENSREVIATAGEILQEDERGDFERDVATDDTRVRTALSWLEEAHLLERNENLVTVFPSSLKVISMDEARTRIASANLFNEYAVQLLAILQALFDADADDGISTDALMATSRLEPRMMRKAMQDLEALGLVSDDTALTAFVHAGVADSSRNRLHDAVVMERAIIRLLKEHAPDLQPRDSCTLDIRLLTQHVRDELLPGTGSPQGNGGEGSDGRPSGQLDSKRVQPLVIRRILHSMTEDRPPRSSVGNVSLRRMDTERQLFTLNAPWEMLVRAAELRASISARLLEHLLSVLPAGARAKDLLAETTMGDLRKALLQDITLRSLAEQDERKTDGTGAERFLTRGLLWMHEQEIIRLNKGSAVFRPAMTLRLAPGTRQFGKQQYEPLRIHYAAGVTQIHIMNEFAQRGLPRPDSALDPMRDALDLMKDYFQLKYETFLQKWLPNAAVMLARQTTAASWQRIVDDLGNANQQAIVVMDGDHPVNELVLAGPGSGKTRTLVHRIAYLVRVLRERPGAIIALTYNRHAAMEIRRRLRELIGEDARGVMVMTIHGMAMRLTGISLADHPPPRRGHDPNDVFKVIIQQATALLAGTSNTATPPLAEEGMGGPEADTNSGHGLASEDNDETRERLLAGFHWILIDEYQDIERNQYDLISALAGRTLKASDDDEADARRMHILAVGDDDQNIYAFNGASVEFIRHFEQDYSAKTAYLVENFRSTRHIIDASNRVIETAANRMKRTQPIRIDDRRRDAPAGGDMTHRDPLAGGRVQVLQLRTHADPASDTWMLQQADMVMQEFQRLKHLSGNDWNWASCAVIAREWRYLRAVRVWCELHGVPVQVARDERLALWSLRETRQLVAELRQRGSSPLSAAQLQDLVRALPKTCWQQWLEAAVDEYAQEMGRLRLSASGIVDWLAEWAHEARQAQHGLLLISAHRTKGLEFDHVGILDGSWAPVAVQPADPPTSPMTDPDESRRLFYVAMTRARKTLLIAQTDEHHPFIPALANASCTLMRTIDAPTPDPALGRLYETPSLEHINLGYAGRFEADAAVHAYIGALQPGDPLFLVQTGERWQLRDAQGHTVGQMARSWRPKPTHRFLAGSVRAIQVRFHAGEDNMFQTTAKKAEVHWHPPKVKQWEVVIPEMVWEPYAVAGQS